ncbi:hypothetical protein BSLG_008446 [Batrachochytrium salamandrivorans]|nr:hypothetical protein BSLG_008446 [Batrachochytrium salamandrivorans]
MESAVAEGKTFHRTCFKCASCKRTLAVSNYVSHRGYFYCNGHLPRDISVADLPRAQDSEHKSIIDRPDASGSLYVPAPSLSRDRRSGSFSRVFAKIKKSMSRTITQADASDDVNQSEGDLPIDSSNAFSNLAELSVGTSETHLPSNNHEYSRPHGDATARVLGNVKRVIPGFKQRPYSLGADHQGYEISIPSIDSNISSKTGLASQSSFNTKSNTAMEKQGCNKSASTSKINPVVPRSLSQQLISDLSQLSKNNESLSTKGLSTASSETKTDHEPHAKSKSITPSCHFQQRSSVASEIDVPSTTRKRASTLGTVSNLSDRQISTAFIGKNPCDGSTQSELNREKDTVEVNRSKADSLHAPNLDTDYVQSHGSSESRDHLPGRSRLSILTKIAPFKVFDTLNSFEIKSREGSDRECTKRCPRSPVSSSAAELGLHKGRIGVSPLYQIENLTFGTTPRLISPDHDFGKSERSFGIGYLIATSDQSEPEKNLEPPQAIQQLTDLQTKIKSNSRELLQLCDKFQNSTPDARRVVLTSILVTVKSQRDSLRELIDLTNAIVTVVDLRRNGIELMKFEREFNTESSSGTLKNMDEFRHLLRNINTNVDFVMRRYPQNERSVSSSEMHNDYFRSALMIKPTTGFKEEGTYDIQCLPEERAASLRPNYHEYALEHVADAHYYRQHFMNEKEDLMDKVVGPGVDPKDTSLDRTYRAILRVKDQPERREVIYPAHIKKSILGKVSTRSILHLLHKDINPARLKVVEDKQIEKKILSLDELRYCSKYKFGVILVLPGQKTDNEYLGNVSGSEEYSNFLKLLGDKIELKGYKGYTGGLDVSNGRTGLHSISAVWRRFEIMFHVATLLPLVPSDEQQIERKRHIGNDIINIVYLDGDAQFDPSTIRSQFTHIFIVVKEEKLENAAVDGVSPPESRVGYRVSVGSNVDVMRFGPQLPEPSIFVNTDEFREFLFCKLINGENSAYKAPKFAKPHQRTHHALFDDIIEEYYNSVGRTTSRSGSFAGTGHERFWSKDHDSSSQTNSAISPSLVGYGLSQASGQINKLLKHTSANSLRAHPVVSPLSPNDLPSKVAATNAQPVEPSILSKKLSAEQALALRDSEIVLELRNDISQTGDTGHDSDGDSSAVHGSEVSDDHDHGTERIYTNRPNLNMKKRSNRHPLEADAYWHTVGSGSDAYAPTLAIHEDALSQAVYGTRHSQDSLEPRFKFGAGESPRVSAVQTTKDVTTIMPPAQSTFAAK